MSDVVIVHGGMFIRCSSAEVARDFLVCLTGLGPPLPLRRPPVSPIMQHVRGEDAPKPGRWEPRPVAPAPTFPAPDAAAANPAPALPTVWIKPGRNTVRGADVDEPREERTRETSVADRIVRAFELDEHQPLPELAAALFGEQTGRALQKLKLSIEQLITRKRLVRTGAASFRPAREAGTDDEDERDSDDEDDEASSFDPSEERPTNLDDEVLSELGIGLG